MKLNLASPFAASLCVLCACAGQSKSTGAPATGTALIELRKVVLVRIEEPTHAQEIAALIDQMEEQDREARQAVAAYRKRLLALNANYDATEDDFTKLFAEFNDERLARQTGIVKLWATAASLMTDAEWDAVGEARNAVAKAAFD
jgi:hypothetical protein